MTHRLVGLNKQTSYSSLNYLAKNVTYLLWCKTSISFPFYSMIYPTATLFSGVKLNTSIRCISELHSHATLHADMMVHAAMRMSFISIFSLNCTVLIDSLISDLPPNHLFTSLMTSKLIYRVIYTAKNGSLIAGFLSVLTVEDVSSGPPGVTALRQLRASWGRYVIIPQSWCSVCVGHTPCAGVDWVTVQLSQNKTQYVTYTCVWYVITDWDGWGCSTQFYSAPCIS